MDLPTRLQFVSAFFLLFRRLRISVVNVASGYTSFNSPTKLFLNQDETMCSWCLAEHRKIDETYSLTLVTHVEPKSICCICTCLVSLCNPAVNVSIL